MPSGKLNRHRRVAAREAVEAALKTGVEVRTPFFRMLYRAGNGPPCVAFLAGRRVGGAVRRNRARRVLREAYRTSRVDLPSVETLVFVAADKVVDARWTEVKEALATALGRASDRIAREWEGRKSGLAEG